MFRRLINWITTVTIRSVRTFSGVLPAIGIIDKPSRKTGISVFMRVKDEEDWIKTSILSIKDFADEIVVVDNASKDNTQAIISDLKDEEGLNLRLLDYSGDDFAEQTNMGLSATTLRYVVRWDADVVAKTSGSGDIRKLREILLDSLKGSYYYAVRYPIPEVRWDLFHQMSPHWGNFEEYAFTGSTKLKWIEVGGQRGRRRGIKTPLYYKRINIGKYFALHCNVKPAKRMLYRRFWTDWRIYHRQKFPSFDEFIKHEIRKKWNTENINLAAYLNFMDQAKHLIPYNKELYGGYPELLRPYLKKPKYRVIYQNGEIVGRSPDLTPKVTEFI